MRVYLYLNNLNLIHSHFVAQLTWPQANKFCYNYGLNMVSIETSFESQSIQYEILSTGIQQVSLNICDSVLNAIYLMQVIMVTSLHLRSRICFGHRVRMRPAKREPGNGHRPAMNRFSRNGLQMPICPRRV